MSFVVVPGHPGPAATPDPGWVCGPRFQSQGPVSECRGSWRLLLAWSGPALHQLTSQRLCWGPDHSGGPEPGGQEAPGAHFSLCLDPQLFEIRPVWSRNAVKANISIHPDKLKVLLPFMAYYMVSASPWFPPESP